ncbi:MAG TPA: AtpZ/AtpI family protein [Syntrophales bacterium]|nr:AtpZ/AtpI family protein [Syntrophales bacterium]
MRTGMIVERQNTLFDILAFSAWGFVIAAGSLLFFWVGLLIDEQLRTEPCFMIGFFILAVFLTIGRLWKKAFQVNERMRTGLIPEEERKVLRQLGKTGITPNRRF